MEIKPIETIYKGHRFRSRLEARFAVFFDYMGIRYIYEPEGYDLGNGIKYLPDFYLPDADQFFEVKGILTELDIEKIEKLSSATGKYVTVGLSDFSIHGCEPIYGYEPCDTYLVKCKKCGNYYFENELSYKCTSCGFYDGDRTFSYISDANTLTESLWGTNQKLELAHTKAIQARFEHGECG